MGHCLQSVIEYLAQLYAQTGGTAGLIIFGFFAVVILYMLTLAYIALQILASIHDHKDTDYRAGKYDERRRNRSLKYNLLLRIVRRIRKAQS